MKIQLLPITVLDYYSFNVLLTELPLLYTQTKEGPAVFANCANTISASNEHMPSLIKTDLFFPSCPATIWNAPFKTHYLIS